MGNGSVWAQVKLTLTAVNNLARQLSGADRFNSATDIQRNRPG
jgi:hypothetical protein